MSSDSATTEKKTTETVAVGASHQSVFNHLQKTSGARTSQPLVESLEKAIEKHPMSNEIAQAMIMHWKAFSLDKDIRSAVESDVSAKAAKALQGVGRQLTRTLKDSGSAPWMSRANDMKIVWKYIDELREKTEVDPKAVTGWGTWSQVKVFKEMAALIHAEIAIAGTTMSKLLYAKFTYNVSKFQVMHPLVVQKWVLVFAGLDPIAEYFSFAKAGTASMLRADKKYVSARYILSKEGLEYVKDKYKPRPLDKDGNKTKMSMESFMADYKTALNFLEEGNTPDVRRLLQCYNVRQANNKLYDDSFPHDQASAIVRGLMKDIIQFWRGEDAVPKEKAITSDSAFTKLYYECVGEISATRRDIVNSILIKKGDADTRTGWQGKDEFKMVESDLGSFKSIINRIAAIEETEEVAEPTLSLSAEVKPESKESGSAKKKGFTARTGPRE